MMGRSHTIIAAFSALIVTTDPKALLYAVPIAALGSWVPDLDHKGSKLSRLLPPISYIISKFAKHRTATHSILAMAAITYTCIYLQNKGFIYSTYCWAFAAGFISHPVADLFTKKGVQLLWPIGPFFRFSPFKTGGKGELIITYMICICILAYVVEDNHWIKDGKLNINNKYITSKIQQNTVKIQQNNQKPITILL